MTYWAALCWLIENQNKLNPNRCHYPFSPILVLTYNFRFPRYNFVSLAGNNASPSCMLKLWWTSCHKWWHHHRGGEPFCFARSHRVESWNMETKIIQLNHFSMGHPEIWKFKKEMSHEKEIILFCSDTSCRKLQYGNKNIKFRYFEKATKLKVSYIHSNLICLKYLYSIE